MTREQNTYQLIPTQNLGSSLVKNLIAKNEYDKLGQLITKEVGGSANNATDRWQEINYEYNIRGWLTNINDIRELMAGKGLPPPSPSDDLFSFAIQYNQIIENGSAERLYNGNIAQTFWKTGSDNTLRGYNYEYDELNRLLNAAFYKKGTSPYSNAYKESLAYDLNGNITSLFRTTADANNNMVEMDDLTYAYENGNGNSNLLKNVSDAVSTQNTDGFVDGNTSLSLDDYEYDVNDFRVKKIENLFCEESERSSMTKDRNKGIESIHYNHLNLPTRVNFTNNKHISYKYNAAGQKLQKTVNYSDSIKIVDYLDGFQTEAGGSRIPYLTIKKHDEQYAGKVLQFFPHTEGYVKVTAISAGRGLPTSDFAFNYVFNYTDHLGNVRLSYSKDPQTGTLEILDEDHYYPFGLKHGVYAAGNLRDFKTANLGDIDTPILEQVRKTEYNYKYNGKELQDELGLDWYDYGARNYDAAIGRWMNVDPLAEQMRKHSPYNYAFDNPIRFIDPDGRAPDDIVLPKGTSTKDTYAILGNLQKLTNDKLVYSTQKDGSIRIKIASLGEGNKTAGTRLIRRLNSSDKVTTIEIGTGGNSARPESRTSSGKTDWTKSKDGTGDNVTVNFNPSSNPSIKTVDPKTGNVAGAKRPNQVGLGHELIHADHITSGDVDFTSTNHTYQTTNGNVTQTKPNEELRTVGLQGVKKGDITENQIREEQNQNPRGAY